MSDMANRFSDGSIAASTGMSDGGVAAGARFSGRGVFAGARPCASASRANAGAVPATRGAGGGFSSAASPLRVVVADDQDVVRSGFRLILSSYDGLNVVGEAKNGEEAVEATRALRPDVVLMDVRMPVKNGIEAKMCIRDRSFCAQGFAWGSAPTLRRPPTPPTCWKRCAWACSCSVPSM